MTEEVDMDIIEDHEENLDSENLVNDSEEIAIEHYSEVSGIDDTLVTETRPKEASKHESFKTTKLPMGRIKSIMKMDPDVNLINSEAVFLVTKATELFLETIAKEAYTYTATTKRKTIAKKDLDYVVNVVDCLCFLEGAMDF